MNPTTRTPKQLGASLRRYRRQRKLSQSELGALVSMRQATVSHLESEGAGTLDTLFAVLSALDLELSLRPRAKSRARLGDIF